MWHEHYEHQNVRASRALHLFANCCGKGGVSGDSIGKAFAVSWWFVLGLLVWYLDLRCRRVVALIVVAVAAFLWLKSLAGKRVSGCTNKRWRLTDDDLGWQIQVELVLELHRALRWGIWLSPVTFVQFAGFMVLCHCLIGFSWLHWSLISKELIFLRNMACQDWNIILLGVYLLGLHPIGLWPYLRLLESFSSGCESRKWLWPFILSPRAALVWRVVTAS